MHHGVEEGWKLLLGCLVLSYTLLASIEPTSLPRDQGKQAWERWQGTRYAQRFAHAVTAQDVARRWYDLNILYFGFATS